MSKETPHITKEKELEQQRKQDRLAEALRENLRRRKSQKRERAKPTPAQSDPAGADNA